MKSFNQFMTEAYSAQEEVNEANIFSRGLGRIGQRAALKLGGRSLARFIPGVGTAYGLYRGTSALMRGDKTGAVLGYGSAIPIVGTGFAAADIARELAGGGQPQAQKPKADTTPAAPANNAVADTAPAAPANNTAAPKPQTVLAKKGGVEGTLDKSTGKWTEKKWGDEGRKRYETARGAEQLKKDATAAKVNTLKTSPEAREIARQGYAGGQQPKSLDLKKEVKVEKPNFANMKPRYTLPKISA